MAAKPETNFSNRVRKHLPKHIYCLKNNNPYAGGVPDLWLSGRKGDAWIEMKYVDPLPVNVPVRPSKLLSALQIQWLDARHDEGRQVAVIIGCKTGGVVLTNKDWHHDLTVEEFKSLILSPTALSEWIQEIV